jgi:hypothetical protein
MAVELPAGPLLHKKVSDEECLPTLILGVPRRVGQSDSGPIPWSSDDMVTFGQAIREGYFNILSDSVLKLTGGAPLAAISARTVPAHLAPGRRPKENKVNRLAVRLPPGVAGRLQQAKPATPPRPFPGCQIDDARLNNSRRAAKLAGTRRRPAGAPFFRARPDHAENISDCRHGPWTSTPPGGRSPRPWWSTASST